MASPSQTVVLYHRDMGAKKKISEQTWKAIKALVDAGWKLVDIEKKFNGTVKASQISAKKRLWKREAFTKDAKYAKFHTDAYKRWRHAVLSRDGFKCVICGRRKGQVKVLQADHIRGWARYPELRFSVENGRTLCIYHHRRTLNYGRKGATYVNSSEEDARWVRNEKRLWRAREIRRKLAGVAGKRRWTKK